MLQGLRPAVARFWAPVIRVLVKLRVTPNMITVAGTVATCTAALVTFPRGAFVAGPLLITSVVVFDMLDGLLARELGIASKFGAWLDSTMDRVADAAIFCGLALWFAGTGDSTLGLALTLYCMVAGMIVSYAKARSEGLGMPCNVGIAERTERLILVLLSVFLTGLGVDQALPIGLGLLAILATITVGQRTAEVRKQADLQVRAAGGDGSGAK